MQIGPNNGSRIARPENRTQSKNQAWQSDADQKTQKFFQSRSSAEVYSGNSPKLESKRISRKSDGNGLIALFRRVTQSGNRVSPNR